MCQKITHFLWRSCFTRGLLLNLCLEWRCIAGPLFLPRRWLFNKYLKEVQTMWWFILSWFFGVFIVFLQCHSGEHYWQRQLLVSVGVNCEGQVYTCTKRDDVSVVCRWSLVRIKIRIYSVFNIVSQPMQSQRHSIIARPRVVYYGSSLTYSK